jgi:RNA polymerase sigma-70 factor (ECF subfamily)
MLTTMTEEVDFARRAAPYRDELLAFGYRMLGSVHDAEDAVQETYLRAWQAYPRFDGRSSLRTWLYRIATNAFLRQAERTGRRALPTDLDVTGGTDVAWIGPFPTPETDPARIVAGRSGLRLALIAALQVLPSRQRAVLILRDVLQWRAAEVAAVLDISTVAVNSLLRRARTQLELAAVAEGDVGEPTDPATRALVDRYATAFERADMAALTRLLTEDAVWEMPPLTEWYAGRDTVIPFLRERIHAPGDGRMIPVSANGQPARALYVRSGGGRWRAHAVHVLSVRGDRIARIVAFHGPAAFGTLNLPDSWPSTGPSRRPRNGQSSTRVRCTSAE